MVRDINTYASADRPKKAIRSALDLLLELTGVLGLLSKGKSDIDKEIEDLVEKRQQARRDKNWALADQIRDELKERGIILEDTPQGVKIINRSN
jgi:cysteinyl-tRNA synthetase